jgi:hypothetical protein
VKASITDPTVLAAMRPLDLSAYLRARGWHPRLGESDLAEWELQTTDGVVEVAVPKHPRWRDYARRVREVIAELSRVEDRSETLIVQDIAQTLRDVVRLRTVIEGRTDGTIPLEDGALLARSAWGMMLAAACATHERRRAFHTRKPQVAVDYMKGLSLGQTEIGSFVLTVISPVPPALAQSTTFLEAAPSEANFNRRVTETLTTALAAIRTAAETSVARGGVGAFEEAVSRGVSADLCEALALVRECTSVTELDLSIGWAAARPELQKLPVRHEFSMDTLEVIGEAGRALREKSPIDSFEVAGVVVALDRPTDAFAGTAVVVADIDRQPRRIRIELFGETDWKTADEAMKRRLVLRCQGELLREGKHYVLRHARDLRIAEDD